MIDMKDRGVLTESMFYVLMSFLHREMCGIEITEFVEQKTNGRVRLGPVSYTHLLFLPPGDHRGGGRRGHARDPLHRPPLPLENQLFLPCGCRLFPRILALFSPLCERTVNFYEIARNFLKLGVDFLF